MKITPPEYYVCDYCGMRKDYPRFKYTDNSGINNQCYDMCSDDCFNKHIEFLKTKCIQDKYFREGDTIEDHIKDWIDKREV